MTTDGHKCETINEMQTYAYYKCNGRSPRKKPLARCTHKHAYTTYIIHACSCCMEATKVHAQTRVTLTTMHEHNGTSREISLWTRAHISTSTRMSTIISHLSCMLSLDGHVGNVWACRVIEHPSQQTLKIRALRLHPYHNYIDAHHFVLFLHPLHFTYTQSRNQKSTKSRRIN